MTWFGWVLVAFIACNAFLNARKGAVPLAVLIDVLIILGVVFVGTGHA